MTLQLRPTFSESWYRVQSLKPRLRPSAQVSRQHYRGELWYVVRDPAANQYHRLSDAAYKFVGLLDGSRTVGEAWELVGGQLADDAPTQPEVIQILSQLYAANLIETNIPPDATVLLRRHKKQQLQKGKQRLMNLLFPRIPLWDPDNFLKTWRILNHAVFSLPGAIIWLIVVGLAIAAVVPHWQQLMDQSKKTLFFQLSIENALLMYLAFAVIKFIHELGHAFSCRRFGGEVHEMGIMFLVLFPAPYVDASSAWSFPNKWQRILVGGGGMVFELFVAAICAFVWVWTKDSGSWLNTFMYNIMLVASVSTVVFNINPLLRYDGYYMLSDWLEIPNLQFRSREYSLSLIKRFIFRVKWSQPLPTPSARPWMVAFFATSGPYRLFVGFMIMILVLYQLPREVQIIGIFMGIASLVMFIGVPIFQSVKYLFTEPELHRKRLRAIAISLVFVAGVVGLTGIWGLPVRVRAQGVVDAGTKSLIYPALAGGVVSEVRAGDGQMVSAGDIIVVARNEELEARVVGLRAQLEGARVQLRSAIADDPAEVGRLREQIAAIEKRLETDEKSLADLTIRSPIAGRLIAPGLKNTIGTWLQPGRPIGEVFDESTLMVYAAVNQNDHGRLTRDPTTHETEVRLLSDLFNPITIAASDTFVASRALSEVRNPAMTVTAGGEIAPDPSDPSGRKVADTVFELQAKLPETASYLPGQRAWVRVTVADRQSLLMQGYIKVRQLILQTQSN